MTDFSTTVLLGISLVQSVALVAFITRWKRAEGLCRYYDKLLDLARHHPPSRVLELTRAD